MNTESCSEGTIAKLDVPSVEKVNKPPIDRRAGSSE